MIGLEDANGNPVSMQCCEVVNRQGKLVPFRFEQDILMVALPPGTDVFVRDPRVHYVVYALLGYSEDRVQMARNHTFALPPPLPLPDLLVCKYVCFFFFQSIT